MLRSCHQVILIPFTFVHAVESALLLEASSFNFNFFFRLIAAHRLRAAMQEIFGAARNINTVVVVKKSCLMFVEWITNSVIVTKIGINLEEIFESIKDTCRFGSVVKPMQNYLQQKSVSFFLCYLMLENFRSAICFI